MRPSIGSYLIPGFASFSSKFGSKEIASAVFMTVFLLAFLDPFLEYLGRTFGIKEVTFGKQRIKVQVGVVAISLLAVLLHSWIEEGVRQVGYSVPAILLMLLLVPGQITAAWIEGVETDRSSWLGLSRGFMLGLNSVWWAGLNPGIDATRAEVGAEKSGYVDSLAYKVEEWEKKLAHGETHLGRHADVPERGRQTCSAQYS